MVLLQTRVGDRFDNCLRSQLDSYNLTNSHSDQISCAYALFLRADAFLACPEADTPGVRDGS